METWDTKKILLNWDLAQPRLKSQTIRSYPPGSMVKAVEQEQNSRKFFLSDIEHMLDCAMRSAQYLGGLYFWKIIVQPNE